VNWFEEIDAPAVLDLLSRWPSLEQRQKAQRKTLETFLRQHRRTSEEAAAWADQVRSAVSAVRDAALLDSYILEVTALVALLKQLQTSIKKFDKAIAAISRQHPCWEIAQWLPGAGPVMAPRLLAAMGNGKRYRNAHENAMRHWHCACNGGERPDANRSVPTSLSQVSATNLS
jgi:hypothetical protein